MSDQKSIITGIIIGVCVLVGIFIATLKRTDRLTPREVSVMSVFRGLTIWTAVIGYLLSVVGLLLSSAIRVGLLRQDEIAGVIGQYLATPFDASSLLSITITAFGVATASMLAMIVMAIELHLRRIANTLDRPGFFNS